MVSLAIESNFIEALRTRLRSIQSLEGARFAKRMLSAERGITVRDLTIPDGERQMLLRVFDQVEQELFPAITS